MSLRILISAALAAVFACGAAEAAAPGARPAKAPGDAALGQRLFGQQCMLCHSVGQGQEGAAPSLYHVVGRKAASDPGFPAYSKALKASGVTWTAWRSLLLEGYRSSRFTSRWRGRR